MSGLLGEKIVLLLRTDLFNSIVSKDIEFFDNNRTGELCNYLISVSRLSSDVSTVQSGISENLLMIFRTVLVILA